MKKTDFPGYPQIGKNVKEKKKSANAEMENVSPERRRAGRNDKYFRKEREMKTAKTLQEKLSDLRYEKGQKTLEEVSAATGISTTALSAYENDELRDISSVNLRALAEYFEVSTDYLLGLSEMRKPDSGSIQDLKIDDKTVNLLSGGKINNRLLCELITHSGFQKFLAGLEIYVDGLANIQIQSLNAVVDTIREKLIENAGAGADDPLINMLQTSHIKDDNYFFNLLHHDLDEIFKDIRAAHAKDADNMPDNSIAEMIRKNMEEYQKEMKPGAPERKSEKPKKILMDQLFYFFTKELRMSRNKLTEEETRVLENLFMRSGRYKEEMKILNRKQRKKQ